MPWDGLDTDPSSGSEREGVVCLLSAQVFTCKMTVLSDSSRLWSSDGLPLLMGGADVLDSRGPDGQGLATVLACGLVRLHTLERVACALLVHSLGSGSIFYTFSLSPSILPERD